MLGFNDLGPAAQEALARLTKPQQDFIKHQFEGKSQTEAYKLAYPANKSPSSCAVDLARKADVQLVMQEMRVLIAKEFAVDEDKIVGAYAQLAFGDIRDFYDQSGNLIPIPQLPRHIANMVQSFEEEDINVGSGENRQTIGTLKKVRLINRKDALDSLARTQGLFITTERNKEKGKAKVVRFPAAVPKEDWQKAHGKS